MRERLRQLSRPIAVYLIALIGLCVLAGPERLLRPSHDNHYSHLAQAWLDGRLEHEGKPPGWCSPERARAKQCRQHSYDDWARVWTIELRDGSSFRGFPCKTSACEQLRRRGVEGWLVAGTSHELREIERREIVRRTETWYVSFPPGPALAMLPAVTIWGTDAPDVLITCVFAALIPVLMLLWFDRERGVPGYARAEDPSRRRERWRGRGREHLWAVAAWTFASPAAFVGAHGRVWFTAQVFGALCLTAYLAAGWNARKPGLAGLALALAVACRPHLAFALPFFAIEWWRTTSGEQRSRRWQVALRFAVPLALIGLLLMGLNYARFADPLEFGHRYLDIRWQQRMQEVGMFSTEYLGRNLRCAFSLAPVWRDGGPWDGRAPRVSLHGSSILIGAPWIFALLWARDRFPQRWGLLISALAVALPSLLYHNSGQIQFSYRFAVDWLPMILAAIVFGGGARSRAFAVLVGLGAIWELYGAWLFGRRPGQLFITDPLGWPFQSELE